MKDGKSDAAHYGALTRHLSPLMVWALSFGCAVGWGAFVMPGTDFLPLAGPLGTALGIAIGALVMLVIGMNYHFLIQRFPDAGGSYSYVKAVCNHDHGYLCAWFLLLTCTAIAWANATALVLIGRHLLGGVFEFGFHYRVAGFDVYFGEILLSIGAILVAHAVLLAGKSLAFCLQTVFALTLIVGVVAAFTAVAATPGGVALPRPAFSTSARPVVQVLAIVVLAPWAFVGFESASHFAEEYTFPRRRVIWILVSALVASALAYILLTLIGAAVLPEGCADWTEYVHKASGMPGLKALPVFNAVKTTLGQAGLILLCATTFSAIATGLIGQFATASRLLMSLARDDIMPHRLGIVNSRGIPANAQTFLVAISCLVPLVGRTAISWIVDVTTIGASIAYGYVSFCAFSVARRNGSRLVQATGAAGLVASIAFVIYFLVPNFWATAVFSTESYLILAGWAIFGLVFFHWIFHKDANRRMGKSTVTWIASLFLIFFASHMWMRQATGTTVRESIYAIVEHYANEPEERGDDREFMDEEREEVRAVLNRNNVVQIGLVVVALTFMFTIYQTISRREREAAKARGYFFSTVSHDIRTPLNAIIGFSEMLKAGFSTKKETDEAVDSILVSSKTLLRLINDVLDLSKLESGKMVIKPEPTDCARLLREIVEALHIAARKPGLELRTRIEAMPTLSVDPIRLRQITFNLVGNAIKFTEKGFVEIRAGFSQTGLERGTFTLEVEDTGAGIGENDQKRIAQPYIQLESKISRHGGTGLGLAITKQLVEAMDGDFSLTSELGRGTTFTISIPNVKISGEANPADSSSWGYAPGANAPAGALAVSPEAAAALDGMAETAAPQERPASGGDAAKDAAPPAANVPAAAPAAAPGHAPHVLLVDDVKTNLIVMKALLRRLGVSDIDTAENGVEAMAKLADPSARHFDIVLTDMWMPEMDGEGLVKAIRANPALASLPVYAVTADVELQKDYQEKGFTGIRLKPMTLDTLKAAFDGLEKTS